MAHKINAVHLVAAAKEMARADREYKRIRSGLASARERFKRATAAVTKAVIDDVLDDELGPPPRGRRKRSA